MDFQYCFSQSTDPIDYFLVCEVRVVMFISPVVEIILALLCWSYLAVWQIEVKRNLCAALRKLWSILVRLNQMRSQKVRSKEVLRYETLRTRARDTGEEVEKLDHFRMNKTEVVRGIQ